MEPVPPPESLSGVFLAPLLASLSPAALWAVPDAFPRGEGFYFSIVKLAFLVLAFLLWVYICNAVQRDADVVEFRAYRSNSLLLGAGVLGLGMTFLCPWLGLSLFGMTVLVCCAVLAYGWQRDKRMVVPFLRPIRKMLRRFFGPEE